MESADCVIALGVLDTDFNYLGVVTPDYNPAAPTSLPGPGHIQAREGAVLVGRGLAYWGDVGLGALLDALLEALGQAGGPLPNAPFPGLEGSPWQIPPPSDFPAADPITFDSFKALLHYEFLEGHDEEHYPQIVAPTPVLLPGEHRPEGAVRAVSAELAWAAIGMASGRPRAVTLADELGGGPGGR